MYNHFKEAFSLEEFLFCTPIKKEKNKTAQEGAGNVVLFRIIRASKPSILFSADISE